MVALKQTVSSLLLGDSLHPVKLPAILPVCLVLLTTAASMLAQSRAFTTMASVHDAHSTAAPVVIFLP